MYIFQLSMAEKLLIYKQVKRFLIENDALNVENLILALGGKVTDIDYILKEGAYHDFRKSYRTY